MSGILKPQPLGPIGSFGLNTQDAAINLNPLFCTEAYNAVVDDEGRLTARQNMSPVGSVETDLAGKPLKVIYKHERKDGAYDIISAGNNLLFTGAGTLTQMGTSGTITDDNWQFASLNGKLFAVQAAHTMMYWSDATYNTPSTITTPFTKPSCMHAAYGRLWVAGVNGNDYTMYWSVLQDGTNFTGTGSGSIDLTSVFVNGKDSIVAIGSHNGKIIVFCRRSTYIFNLPADLDPNGTDGISLFDVISNVGCCARDTVVSTGDDVLWLSYSGVQSLARRNQTDTLPLTDMSRLVHQTMINRVVINEDLKYVRGYYYPNKSWYLLSAPKSQAVWVFHMALRVPETSVPRVTQWVSPIRAFWCFCHLTDGTLYVASDDRLWSYVGYGEASDKYVFRITTGWLPLNDPATLKHFKKVLLTLRGGSGQTGTLSWGLDFKDRWDSVTFRMGEESSASEYGIAEYEDATTLSEYTAGNLIDDLYMSIGGSAKFIRFRVSTEIQGEIVSIYNFTTFNTQGKVR